MTAETHWASRRERGAYLGLRTIMATYGLLGRRLVTPVLHVVIAYYFLASPTARSASKAFLERVWEYPEGKKSLEKKPGWGAVYRHLYAFGSAALDKLTAWNGDVTEDQLIFQNHDLFRSHASSGKGCVWIASHLGNIEVIRAMQRSADDVAMTVLVHTRHAANFNRILHETNPNSALELVEVTDFDISVAMRLQERVARGEFIVIVGDRTPVSEGQRTVEAPFLGENAKFPMGPFLMAVLLQCPMAIMFCFREGDKFHIVLEALDDGKSVIGKQRNEVVEAAVAKYAGQLQKYALRYPMQWFNFYDFWGSIR